MSKKIKFLFVQPEHENIGIEYLSGSLKNGGHQVELTFFPRPLENVSFSIGKENIEKENKQLEYDFLRIKPDIVAFSPFTAHYQWAIQKAEYLKNKYKCFIFFGGVHTTFAPETVIMDKNVDAILIGEGEEALLEFADKYDSRDIYNIRNIWVKKGSEIIKNPLRPVNQFIDKLPFPDKSLFYDKYPSYLVKGSAYTLLSGRGCPFACTYCCNDVYGKVYKGENRIRFRAVKNVIEEINFFVDKYKFGKIDFVDDVLALNISRLEELLPIYTKSVGLPFMCFLHTNLLTEDMVRLLSEHRCLWLRIGVQSASEEYRRKVLNRTETNEKIIKVADWCRKHRLNFSFDHIFNLPGETEKDLIAAVNLYNRCRPTIINFGNLLYFPKTKIIDFGIKEGAIKESDIALIDAGLNVVSLESNIDRILGKKKLNKETYNISVFSLYFILISLVPPAVIRFMLKMKLYKIKFRVFPALLIFLKVLSKFKAGQGYLYINAVKYSFYWLFAAKRERLNQA